ncbi:MAG: cation:proton antiporter [Candidatus Micrarchaeota archaeon]
MIAEFFLLGSIIIIGFFSMQFFEKTKLPDILFLMLLGVLLGPVFGVVDSSSSSIIKQLSEFIGTLALIILLFDGGINLNIFRVVRDLGKASIFTILVFILSTTLIAFTMRWLAGWTFFQGLLLGAVVGGSSSAIVISVLSKTSASNDTKTILTLESAMTDALCVIGALMLTGILLSNNVSVASVGGQLASAFSVAFVSGLLFAIGWTFILKNFTGKPFGYLLTLAVLFILYASTEYLGGRGAIAVLIFGIVLSSMQQIASLMKFEGDFKLEDKMRQFQIEVSFFVRTFFFVYLGLIVTLADITLNLILVSIALLIGLIIARGAGIKLMGGVFTDERSNFLIMTMLPRGLAAAVLAFYPEKNGIVLPGFTELVFLVIILTNILATIGVFMFESSKPIIAQNKPQIVSRAPQYPYKK